MRLRTWLSSTLLLGVVFGGLVAVNNAQAIRDWWFLRSYEPSQQIETLADTLSLSERGRDLLYVGDPELLNKQNFNFSCSFPERSLVLGCYDGDIYILNVNDNRLDKVEEVTAAHEMLHAAYQRLDTNQKRALHAKLDEQLEKITNQRLISTVESYREADSSTLYNEMHSMFGTEVRDLTDELEAYYSQYFQDRSVVVGYAEEYEAVFIKIEERIKRIDEQLANHRSTIESLEAELESLSTQIQSARQQLDALRNADRIEEYNSRVPGFNNLVNEYNTKVARLRDTIASHNSLVEERNATALEQNDLIHTLDSSYQPI